MLAGLLLLKWPFLSPLCRQETKGAAASAQMKQRKRPCMAQDASWGFSIDVESGNLPWLARNEGRDPNGSAHITHYSSFHVLFHSFMPS